MKYKIKRLSDKELLKTCPINNLVSEWFFRIDEISNGGFKVSGKDVWGREVSRTGGDPDLLLNLCIEDARQISLKISNI